MLSSARELITAWCQHRRIFSLPVPYFLSIVGFVTLTVLPLTLWEYGGDIMFQYVGMECFASQFWQGDLYPRWCFTANSGLGAPIFVYYFPLPFYIASIFYPLIWLGLSIKGLYLLCLWLVGIVTALCAWRWLSSMTTVPLRALFLTFIYLILPYRMELMMFRAAYGELWCMAFLPLVFHAIRMIALEQRNAIALLAISLALCYLSNMPAAVIGTLASGGYMVIMAYKTQWKLLAHYMAGFLWAVALCAFYLVPAILYKSFVTTEGVISGTRSWSNDFLTMANITQHGQGHVVIVIALTLLTLLGMVGFCLWHRRKLSDPFILQETYAWIILAAIAVCMLFPVSRVLWDHLGFIAMLAFPWRMQLIVAFALMYLAYVIVDKILPQLRPKARTGDIIMPFMMLGLLSLFVISAPVPDFVKHGKEMMEARYVTQREYRTIWTDKAYIEMDYILWRHHNKLRIPKAELIDGQAGITPISWKHDNLVLEVNVHRTAKVRLDLQYFPMWQVHSQPARSIDVSADKGSGQMVLNLPKGHYYVTLKSSIFTQYFWSVLCASILSVVALCAWLLRHSRYMGYILKNGKCHYCR